MGSMEPMETVRKRIIGEGTEFVNMFVTTPVCCPSRSSILSGKYVHNNGAKNNSLEGNCASDYWMEYQEPYAFPTHLKSAGYRTFYAGKYLNQYGYPEVGGAKHVPPGWDWWNGLIGQSYYYDYPMSQNGTRIYHGKLLKDYLTTVIEKYAMEFLNTTDPEVPFFMMLCPTAPHGPFTFLPQYNSSFLDRKIPRTLAWNHHSEDKHWILRQTPSTLPKTVITKIDENFRKRWRTLKSVDEMVKSVITQLENRGILDETYIIYTSDNGYHMGQFCLPNGKREPYDMDIRVPLAIRGPGVLSQKIKDPVLNIDLAPSILNLANLTIPTDFDGKSFNSRLHLGTANDPPRTRFLLEYWGTGEPHGSGVCPNTTGEYACLLAYACICDDASNNTYSCVRSLGASENSLYCEFSDLEHFTEFYDLNQDKEQIKNTVHKLEPKKLASYKQFLRKLEFCRGSNCLV